MGFYTYLWLRYDGTPYYVGKGKDNRAFASHKRHRPPKNHELIIIQEFDSEEDAFFAEKFLIAYWGRKSIGGTLINLYEGGQGMVLPPESIEKRQISRYGEGYVRKYPQHRKDKITPEERSKQCSAGVLKYWEQLRATLTPEQISEKARQAAYKVWEKRHLNPPTHCRKGHLYTPETTYIYKNLRYCTICRAACQERHRAKKITGGVNGKPRTTPRNKGANHEHNTTEHGHRDT
jgi:hypothetical protein